VLTVAEFLDGLGGQARAAERFGVTRTTAQKWASRNEVPPKRWACFRQAAAETGLIFDPEKPGVRVRGRGFHGGGLTGEIQK
jgi:hypothetical protein